MDDSNIEEISNSRKIPNQQELEEELSEYLSKKYGDRIKIISPLINTKGQVGFTDDGKPTDDEGTVR